MRGVGTSLTMVSLAASCSICLAACAQITVVTDQAPPQTEWKFGVLAIDLAGSSRNTIIQSTGVGIISTPSGATAGYSSSKVVRLGEECRVVISTPDLEAISKDRELARLLRKTHKACTT